MRSFANDSKRRQGSSFHLNGEVTHSSALRSRQPRIPRAGLPAQELGLLPEATRPGNWHIPVSIRDAEAFFVFALPGLVTGGSQCLYGL